MSRWPAVAYVVLSAAPITAAAKEPHLTFRGACMGTTYAVTIADRPAKLSMDAIAERIADELERIEQIFSLFRPDSELCRLNAAVNGQWIGVSDDLLAVAKRAMELAQETGGAFDPTVGPLVRLWRLRRVESGWSPPTEAAIAEARKRVGWRLVKLHSEPPAICKITNDVELDFNSLVEGWAIDRVGQILIENRIQNALIELGGEFRGMGCRSEGRPWRIGIENPQEATACYATAALDDLALSTSGDYRQGTEFRGRRYSHLLDARTGKPIEHDLAAVSVIANDATTADGWATALMVLGPVDGFALAQNKGLAASFFLRAEELKSHSQKTLLTMQATGRIVLEPSH